MDSDNAGDTVRDTDDVVDVHGVDDTIAVDVNENSIYEPGSNAESFRNTEPSLVGSRSLLATIENKENCEGNEDGDGIGILTQRESSIPLTRSPPNEIMDPISIETTVAVTKDQSGNMNTVAFHADAASPRSQAIVSPPEKKMSRGDSEVRSMSVFLDGRASIEHQIDIHVVDIVDSSVNKDIPLGEVLDGVKYVYDYRIEGGRMPHLNADLMARLLEALLGNMGHIHGTFFSETMEHESKLAFTLFGNFLEEVEEFRTATGRKTSADLMHSLRIHIFLKSAVDERERRDVVSVLGLLVRFPQFSDWTELVDPSAHAEVRDLIAKYPESFQRPAMQDTETIYPPPALYFDKNSERLAEMFGSSVTDGLPLDAIEKLREVYGRNALPPAKKRSIFLMIWDQLYNFMIIILIAATIAEFATGDSKSAVVLIIVIVLNTVIGFTQEYKASKAIDALSSLTVPKAAVIRGGERMVVESSDLVPGDLVLLEEGDAVPADLRLCEVSQLDIIEILLTGESLPVTKSIRTIRKRSRRIPLQECKGNAFMSTVVARGRGKGIVVRTGISTEVGKISNAITEQPHRKTNLEKKLDRLGKWLVVIAILLCILIVLIGVGYKNNAKDQVKVGISLAVSVIPEGLVAVVTVTMALGVVRMAKRNAIVRKLPSVETLGSVNLICSDKTGTLTEGKMGTDQIWCSNNTFFRFHEATNMDPHIGAVSPYDPLNEKVSKRSESVNVENVPTNKIVDYKPPADALPKSFTALSPYLVTCILTASMCNNSQITYDEEKKAYSSLGDPTEVAMVLAAEKAGISREYLIKQIGLEKMGEYAFDSDRKLMSVIYTQGTPCEDSVGSFKQGTGLVFAKGAPEGILSKSVSYLANDSDSINGNLTPFAMNSCCVRKVDDNFITLVSETSSLMAKQGLRVLALAIRYVTVAEAKSIVDAKTETASECELTFVGLIGLIDPPKAGVKESVAICRTAGIKVVMMTGDHITTASSIAEKLGIMDPEDPERSRAMKGSDVDALSEEQLVQLDPFPAVFARLSPDNKLKIVRALQSRGNQVAVTGDGVNDAPAIKQADVGISMGINGTEITKQAADIILADDNFSTIIAAIREGRGVFDNIVKFIVYLLSCNSAEIFLFLAAALGNQSMPFTTIQILYANIIADVPPAMALGFEPVEPDVMERPPRPADSGVLDIPLSCFVVAQGLFQSMISFTVYMLARRHNFAGYHTERDQESITFLLLTMMQLLQSFYNKSISKSIFVTGIFGNKWLLIGFVVSITGLILGIYAPNFNTWLELEDVDGKGWAVVIVCLVIHFVLVECTKALLRWHMRYRALHAPKRPLVLLGQVSTSGGTSAEEGSATVSATPSATALGTALPVGTEMENAKHATSVE